MVCALARRHLPDELAGLVAAYRGGFLPDQRRRVEADLASGRLRGVVTTSALELGVDIAGLDACLIDGFPGTIASLRQQAGRAGRSRRQSLAVLVAGPTPWTSGTSSILTRCTAAPLSRPWSTRRTRSSSDLTCRARPTRYPSTRPTSGGGERPRYRSAPSMRQSGPSSWLTS